MTWSNHLKQPDENSFSGFLQVHIRTSPNASPENVGVFVGNEPKDRFQPYQNVNGLNFREYPHKIWPYMVQYLHFKILKFPYQNVGVDSFAAINGSWRSARRDRSFGRKLPHDTPRLCTFSCPPVMPGSTAGKKTRPKFGMLAVKAMELLKPVCNQPLLS